MGGRGSSSGKAMSVAEQDAVEYYASGDGMWINNALRGRHGLRESDMTAEDRKLVKDLDSALNKTVGEQTLYRSVDASAIFGRDVDMYDLVQEITHKTYSGQKGKYAQNKAEQLNRVINGAIGKEITDKGYVSTTRDKNIAENWQDFTGSENPIVMRIQTSKSTKGADISHATKKLSETERANPQKETLLARNQKYKIKKVYSQNGYVYVDVTM